MVFPFDVQALHDCAELNRKYWKGLECLTRLREDDLDIGCTAKEEVYREDNVVLYRFVPSGSRPFPIPVLIVYALINRPLMVDLQEDRSLVRNLVHRGIDVYLIDWGYPTRADRWLTVDDYINGYLNTCVDVILEKHALPQLNVLGICQGGVFSLCYTALYSAKVKNLITMVTPVDFHVTDGLLNLWAGCTAGPANLQHDSILDVDLLVKACGNIPSDFVNWGFLMMKPFQLGVRKYLDFLDVLDHEEKVLNFLRMEKWIFDSPDQAGEAYRQFIKDLYQGNKLIKGEFKIGRKDVDLRNIDMPVFNVYAEQDHLVPPASSLALGSYLGTRDYSIRGFPVGHIGMYVSGKVQQALGPALAEWITARGS